MIAKKRKSFWQIEMSAKNLLELHQCYNKPYEGIDQIFESMNIQLIPLKNVKNPNFSGFYGNDGSVEFVAYDGNQIPERILFTKAHELGHIILNHNLKSDIVDESAQGQKDPIETEANVFASSFLMPRDLVWTLVRDSRVGVEVPFTMLDSGRQNYLVDLTQERFRVSRAAAGYRLGDVIKIK